MSGPNDPGPDPESVARTVALRRLAAAPQTRAQLDQAMAKRGVPEDVREHVLGRFADVGLIDDEMFAEMWVESRQAGKGLGRRALAHELRQRGVSANVVEQAVESVTPESEAITARELVDRKLVNMGGLDPAKRNRRLASMLARKGYPAGLAYRVIREALETRSLPADDVPIDDQ